MNTDLVLSRFKKHISQEPLDPLSEELKADGKMLISTYHRKHYQNKTFRHDDE